MGLLLTSGLTSRLASELTSRLVIESAIELTLGLAIRFSISQATAAGRPVFRQCRQQGVAVAAFTFTLISQLMPGKTHPQTGTIRHLGEPAAAQQIQPGIQGQHGPEVMTDNQHRLGAGV